MRGNETSQNAHCLRAPLSQPKFARTSFTSHCVIGFASGTRVCLLKIENARNKLAALTLANLTLSRTPFLSLEKFSSSSLEQLCIVSTQF